MDDQNQQVQQQTPVQTETPPQTSNNNLLKTLSIGLGIIGIGIVIGIGGYFLGTKKSQPPVQKAAVQVSSTPDPTAKWKTYQKDKLWTIKYPPSWFVVKEGNYGYVEVSFSDQSQVTDSSSSGDILMVIRSANGNNSYDSRISKGVGTIKTQDGNSYTTVKKITVDSYPGVIEQNEFLNNGPAKPTYEYQALIHGPLNVAIVASALKYNQPGFSKENYDKQFFPLFDQIFSTFKFTN